MFVFYATTYVVNKDYHMGSHLPPGRGDIPAFTTAKAGA